VRVAIGGQALTIEDVFAVARGGAVAELTGPARERIVRAHEVIARVIA
jgi:histidine ammonia-lyase